MDMIVVNVLIIMYCKCNSVQEVWEIFDWMSK